MIKTLTWLASPIGLLFAFSLSAATLRLINKGPRLRLLFLTFGIVQLLLFAWPPVAVQLTKGLEDKARVLQAHNNFDQNLVAILVLGGGITPALPVTTPLIPANANQAFDRVMEAAKLYHKGLAPCIIVSGGNSLRDIYPDAQTEAQAMKDALLLMGVPESAILLEGQSLTTRENITYTAELLKNRSINGKIALLTSATHIPRAYENAVRSGLNVDLYATDWITPLPFRGTTRRWLPNAMALEESEIAIKEWIALLVGY